MEDPRDSIGRLGNRVTPSKNLGQFSLKTRGRLSGSISVRICRRFFMFLFPLSDHWDPNTGKSFPGAIGGIVVHDFCTSASICHGMPWLFRPSSGTRNGAQAHSADQVQPCTTMYNQQNWALGRARLPIWAANSCKLLTLNPIMDSSRGIMGIGIKPDE